jgi:hypothetical protein
MSGCEGVDGMDQKQLCEPLQAFPRCMPFTQRARMALRTRRCLGSGARVWPLLAWADDVLFMRERLLHFDFDIAPQPPMQPVLLFINFVKQHVEAQSKDNIFE